MKVYLTEGCCLFYSDSRAVTKWEPELFGFLPLARKVPCTLPVQLSPPRMSLLLLSKPYASFNPISNISLFILPMGEFWNLPKVIKHIRGKLREPDCSHPVQYFFFHTSVVQRAQCPACLRNVIYLLLPLSRGVIIPINTKGNSKSCIQSQFRNHCFGWCVFCVWRELGVGWGGGLWLLFFNAALSNSVEPFPL